MYCASRRPIIPNEKEEVKIAQMSPLIVTNEGIVHLSMWIYSSLLLFFFLVTVLFICLILFWFSFQFFLSSLSPDHYLDTSDQIARTTVDYFENFEDIYITQDFGEPAALNVCKKRGRKKIIAKVLTNFFFLFVCLDCLQRKGAPYHLVLL